MGVFDGSRLLVRIVRSLCGEDGKDTRYVIVVLVLEELVEHSPSDSDFRARGAGLVSHEGVYFV